MKKDLLIFLVVISGIICAGCFQKHNDRTRNNIKASEILGNPEFLAFSYGGYRQNTRDHVPSVEELKDDMKILEAMDIKLLRTYNTQQYGHTSNLLEAIRQLKEEDADFEMYVMLGTWIECEGAWTSSANHHAGNIENNTAEIEAAVRMVNEYPDIVKIIAVGNEAMVQWAVNYFVYPDVISKWVDCLQGLKSSGEIPKDIWITSSDNYESWGGGAAGYRTEALADLIRKVDFVSLHTYPFHDSHYNPTFWGVPVKEESLSKLEKIDSAMMRAKNYAMAQYQEAANYMASLGIEKAIHIGETGWATKASSSYGASGSRAADEFKEKLYYDHMRAWTKDAGMTCFYFEAFDEQWKDAGNPLGSENHFGMINLEGEAKYALWERVDQGIFTGLTRNGRNITKTYGGNEEALINEVLAPLNAREMGILEVSTINENRVPGEKVSEDTYVVVSETLIPDNQNNLTYPSEVLILNAWEGTCGIEMSQAGDVEVKTGTGSWWGCALEIKSGGVGEDLSNFKSGFLNVEIKGSTKSSFHLGFQTGSFAAGTQVNNYVTFGPGLSYFITDDWTQVSIPIAELDQGMNLEDVQGILFFRGDTDLDGKSIFVKNIYYSKSRG